jgi:hypothetical protein
MTIDNEIFSAKQIESLCEQVNKNLSKAAKVTIVCKQRPKQQLSGVSTAQPGRDYVVNVDGKPLSGVLSKSMDFKPNEIATLTIVMKLPEIVYLEDD